MINRRELFTWWRVKPKRDIAPFLARVVEPTPIDDPEPFSLTAFYAARKETK